MKKKSFSVLLVIVFVAGLSLMLYPMISNAYNDWLQSKTIAEYSNQVGQMSQQMSQEAYEKAQAFNASLLERENPFILTEKQLEEYPQMLNLSALGIMAYVEIPSIDVTLPIAHGTDETTLRDKIGHIEWSSLPVGGENTHCVISGHRGLPSSELFTNIDHLELGDKFYIHVLGKTLEYQVCNIVVVEPEDQTYLRIMEGKDLVTMVTCTPYGINSHRLLVQGIRAGTDSIQNGKITVKNEVTNMDPLVLVCVLLVIIAVIAFVILLMGNGKKRRLRNETEKNS